MSSWINLPSTNQAMLWLIRWNTMYSVLKTKEHLHTDQSHWGTLIKTIAKCGSLLWRLEFRNEIPQQSYLCNTNSQMCHHLRLDICVTQWISPWDPVGLLFLNNKQGWRGRATFYWICRTYTHTHLHALTRLSVILSFLSLPAWHGKSHGMMVSSGWAWGVSQAFEVSVCVFSMCHLQHHILTWTQEWQTFLFQSEFGSDRTWSDLVRAEGLVTHCVDVHCCFLWMQKTKNQQVTTCLSWNMY